MINTLIQKNIRKYTCIQGLTHIAGVAVFEDTPVIMFILLYVIILISSPCSSNWNIKILLLTET